MFRSALVLTATALVALTATANTASAAPKNGFVIFDQTGKKIFDDGKLDGKGCVIGKKVVFNPITGQLKVVPAVKCVGF